MAFSNPLGSLYRYVRTGEALRKNAMLVVVG
jgi:hypothetical protein